MAISLSNEDAAKISSGDMRALRTVLEAELEMMKEKLLFTSARDDFRYYQGVNQTLIGILKLLPESLPSRPM